MLDINNEFTLDRFKLVNKNDIMPSNYVYLWLKLLLFCVDYNLDTIDFECSS